ncbi:Hypothetical protein CAP_2050 [Chondromyces apiculatus DSM 436]|uniref:Uncharacterized protein n=1 Tax=Chondromyces apiculatus DSM 436 TaxID=1192034 RepID=A0A017ST72_9BACT|nr:Hypothetical protein CAP_2050 [Chondromyces apiculatus DSM 436]
MRAFPTHVPWIQAQLGLTPETWRALHGLWQERFQRDAGLRDKWQQLIAQRLPHWKQG